MLKHTLPTSQRLGELVLGVDPGLNITGYGLVEVTSKGPKLREAGVVRGRTRGSLELRLQEIYDGVVEILTSFQPTTMAVEQLYSHYGRPRTAILMGHARGVICLAAVQHSVSLRHYGATMVKKMLTGNGRASKPQVQMAICRQFGLAQAPEPPDVADALAVALCHVFNRNVLADNPGVGVTLDLDDDEEPNR